MKVKIAAVVVVLCAATLGWADEWNRAYTVSAKPAITVDAGDGNVHVITGAADKVLIHVSTRGWQIGQDGVRVDANQSGDRIDLEIRVPHQHFSFGNRSIEITLTVPPAADLDMHTSDGNVTVAAIKGNQRIRTGDGNVEVRGADGSLSAQSGDGNLNIDGRFDQLDLRTGDGEIDATADNGSKMNMGWSLSSGDGNISLRVPDNFAADLDAHTGDGRVTVDMPVTMSGSMREGTVRGRMNGGGSILSVHSGDGNLHIGKS